MTGGRQDRPRVSAFARHPRGAHLLDSYEKFTTKVLTKSIPCFILKLRTKSDAAKLCKEMETMTKRERILNSIVGYVAEGDESMAMRLYVENRISRDAFNEALTKGRSLRAFCAAKEA